MKVTKIRFPQTSSIGIKPISLEGSSRIISSAIDYAIKNNRKSVTVVHKGNIMKFTEGMFRSTAYDLALSKFSGYKEGEKTFVKSSNGSPVQIKDCICDAFLQNILLKPQDYDVIVTPNLNGDYVSDALAAEVGGIGIAPGANINPDTGMAVFEATHGSAPDIAGKGIANPLSILLSACMMLEFIGYDKASVRIKNAVRSQILSKRVTSDFYATMTVNGQKAVCLKLDEFTNELIDRL